VPTPKVSNHRFEEKPPKVPSNQPK